LGWAIDRFKEPVGERDDAFDGIASIGCCHWGHGNIMLLPVV